MTDQEFKDFYDQACVQSGHIPVADIRTTMQLILQMIAHLQGMLKQMFPKDTTDGQ